jgi:hypothetical protein
LLLASNSGHKNISLPFLCSILSDHELVFSHKSFDKSAVRKSSVKAAELCCNISFVIFSTYSFVSDFNFLKPSDDKFHFSHVRF